jgi:hypothetical protein
MLNVIYAEYYYVERPYAECHYVKCHGALSRGFTDAHISVILNL